MRHKRATLLTVIILLTAVLWAGCDSASPVASTGAPGISIETPGLSLVPGNADDALDDALPGDGSAQDGADSLPGDEIPPPRWTLEVEGAEFAFMTSYDFETLPHTTVDVDGATFSGVLLMDVLSFLKLAPGASYEVQGTTQNVALAAGDIISPETLLADAKNAMPIEAPEGPLLLVVGKTYDLWLPGVVGIKPAPDGVK